MANFNISNSFNGLGTFRIASAPIADVYTISGKIALPTISAGSSANSQVVILVKKNSTTIYTGLAGAEGFMVNAPLAAADVISIVLSSSADVDQQLNSIKTTVSMYEGQP